MTDFEDYVIKKLNKLENMLTVSQPVKIDETPEMAVISVLRELGVSAHLKGYLYLRDSILMMVDNEDLLGKVTTEIYPYIAAKYKTTPARVERAIRNAIQVAWIHGQMSEMFHKEPTNSEVMANLADRIHHPEVINNGSRVAASGNSLEKVLGI